MRRILVLVVACAWAVIACGGIGPLRQTEPLAEPAEVVEEAPPTAVQAEPSPQAEQPSPTLPSPTLEVAQPPEASEPAAPPAGSADLASAQIDLRLVAGGFNRPHAIASAGDGSGRVFVAEKTGTILIVRDGTVEAAPFLDISDRVGTRGTEQGLLGVAFHPDYAAKGTFFVNYTDRGGDTVVSRFSVSPSDPDRADPASEQVVLTQSQPASNHNGGHILFGPDGYLWIGLGDGGAAGDAFGNGQNGATWLGSMLRIDVNADPYAIPADNPYVNDPNVADEIWAIGLRNPWRYAFDPATGDLYIADVGQNIYEEVNFTAGGSAGGVNYGWPITEGLHCYDSPSCDPGGSVLPIAEYSHSEGCSITGGYVYRGAAYPSLNGIYFFGDYCTGYIWGLARDSGGNWGMRRLLSPDIGISSFGVDDAGEHYVLDYNSGSLYQIIAN